MQQFNLVCIPLAFRYPSDKMSFSSFVFTLFIIIFIHHDIIEKIIVKRANVFFFFHRKQHYRSLEITATVYSLSEDAS